MAHEDETIVEELRRIGERAIEQAAAGDFYDARDSFREAAFICQGVDWMEKEVSR